MLTTLTRRMPLTVALAGILLATLLALTPFMARVSAQGTVTFRATITNTTNPEMIITPGAYLVHSADGAFWSMGSPAGVGLERIAEIGNPAAAVDGLGAVALGAAPASGATVTFEFSATPGDKLSFAQMLIASNDGFIGLDSMPLWDGGGNPVSTTVSLNAYDAGTEANTDLFSGFDGGQPDPARGADNVENGTATADAVGPHDQFGGAQATITISPVVAGLPATGSGGLAGGASGVDAWAIAAIAALGLVVVGAGLRVVTQRR
ncbi:MAG: Spondin N [Chloroflexi bacterium]|nr:MAG: Spondin N [Chloroflexota bacterium]